MGKHRVSVMRKLGRLKIVKVMGEYQLRRMNSQTSSSLLFTSKDFMLINSKFDLVKDIAI